MVVGTTARGPLTVEELVASGLRPETLVWTEGMAQWEPAGRIEALRPVLQGVPVQIAYATATTGRVVPPYDPSRSNRIAAGVCGILLGAFGVHKFIAGLHRGGAAMLAITLGGWLLGTGCMCVFAPFGFVLCFAPMVMAIIGLVEGILYLTRSDYEFYLDSVVRRRQWF